MKNNSEIRTLALDSLKGRWWEAIIVIIGFLLFIIPYIYCTIGQFYEELKANA